MPGMNYGYTSMRPDEPFEPFCVGKIFIDQLGDAKLPAFEELIHVLNPEDQVMVPSLVCLGWSFSRIWERWERIRDTGARIVILDWPDSQTMAPELLDRMVHYLQHTQEELKNSGSINVIRRSMAQSGPKPKDIPVEFEEISEKYKQGDISSRGAAEQLHVSHTTFLRWFRTIPLME